MVAKKVKKPTPPPKKKQQQQQTKKNTVAKTKNSRTRKNFNNCIRNK